MSEDILGDYLIQARKLSKYVISDNIHPSTSSYSYTTLQFPEMKLTINPKLKIPISTELSNEIADIFNNGYTVSIELHNSHGGR